MWTATRWPKNEADPFLTGIEEGGGGGGGEGGCLASTSFITMTRQRPGQGQITSINDATRANFKVHGAHPGFPGCMKERKEFPWTDFLGCRKEGYWLCKPERERKRERDVMCRLTATFSLKVHQNGKAWGLERKVFYCFFFCSIVCFWFVLTNLI